MGLRELKKERTRLSILDAALDLFLEQGYESTTVEQIAGAVEISPRTFFRYFTSKDHLVLWFHDHGEGIMLETLRSVPSDEPPFTALMHAVRAVLSDMQGSTPADAQRFLKLRRLLEEHPHLVGLSVARGADTERRMAELIAARRGTDPDQDQLCHLIVAFAMSTMRVGFECPRRDGTVTEIIDRMRETIALAERSLRPGWDL
ncbi:TetR family transcriptional regulator [Nonomuraea jiangxiensis]|uniref:DNA-binding transcriptional regulator, AcrR family n=1 Tax=Nonomuraea jiangxiensis TaxID=633440 RepID=A0A1G8V8F2_9ACTN|nr:TetR family transcriptional regulator [Nonomuraea jiangxiensis]SDJ62174.1 DNA-binding transcriptional regulator, AcrR family [Nonomuraea jiangxiensis]